MADAARRSLAQSRRHWRPTQEPVPGPIDSPSGTFVSRLVQATGQPAEHIELALDRGLYMNAEEALHYRLIDEICSR